MPTATIKDKLALVTGGSRGIGLAISRALLERGARVWICALRPASLEIALTALRKQHGSRVGGEICDVRAAKKVHATFDRLRRDWKGLDILVNNAGIGIFKSVADMTPAEWEASIETNLSGVFHCCREAIPLMKARGGGYIVNIGSLAGKNPFAGGAAYNASKFGLIGFSEALMQEVRYEHIRVSCIMPGSVNTEFGQSGEEDAARTWKLLPEDVAETVVHLLETDPRALPSRVEIRPSEPKKVR